MFFFLSQFINQLINNFQTFCIRLTPKGFWHSQVCGIQIKIKSTISNNFSHYLFPSVFNYNQ